MLKTTWDIWDISLQCAPNNMTNSNLRLGSIWSFIITKIKGLAYWHNEYNYAFNFKCKIKLQCIYILSKCFIQCNLNTFFFFLAFTKHLLQPVIKSFCFWHQRYGLKENTHIKSTGFVLLKMTISAYFKREVVLESDITSLYLQIIARPASCHPHKSRSGTTVWCKMLWRCYVASSVICFDNTFLKPTRMVSFRYTFCYWSRNRLNRLF